MPIFFTDYVILTVFFFESFRVHFGWLNLHGIVIVATVVLYIEVIKTVSSLFFKIFFFEEKILCAQKHVTSKNQLTKQK